MQEEVNEKTISVCIKGGKITANALKAALKNVLSTMEKHHEKSKQKKAPENTHGKQTMKGLMAKGYDLTNIEITDQNIKSFDRVARKYSIDYSLKKDKSVSPPRYLVFFRAKDVDVMTAAFREYTGLSEKKQNRQSIRKKLEIAKERLAKHREREKTHQKDRGQSL